MLFKQILVEIITVRSEPLFALSKPITKSRSIKRKSTNNKAKTNSFHPENAVNDRLIR